LQATPSPIHPSVREGFTADVMASVSPSAASIRHQITSSSTESILWDLGSYCEPGKVDDSIHQFVYRPSTNHAGGYRRNQQTMHTIQPPELLHSLVSCIQLLGTPIVTNSDVRKSLFTLLLSLMEKSESLYVLLASLQLVNQWITTPLPKPGAPTVFHSFQLKERLTLLSRVLDLSDRLDERKFQPLFILRSRMCLNLCKLVQSMEKKDLEAIEHTTLPIIGSFRSSLTVNQHLNCAFMAGLNSIIPSIRTEFKNMLVEGPPSYVKTAIALHGGKPSSWIQLLMSLDWESLSISKYWVSSATELLMAHIDVSQPRDAVSCSPFVRHAAAVESRCTHNNVDVSTFAIQERPSLPTKQPDILQRYVEFIQSHTIKASCSNQIVQSLGSLVHFSMELSHTLWVQLYRDCWESLNPLQQGDVVPTLTKLLARPKTRRRLIIPSGNLPYNSPAHRLNVVGTLLDGIKGAYPLPNFEPKFLQYLAKTFNCWYLVAPMMERQMFAAPEEDVDGWVTCLQSLYTVTGDSSMSYGLRRLAVQSVRTKRALMLQTHQRHTEALTLYHSMIQNMLDLESIPSSFRLPRPNFSAFEISLWEEQWIDCLTHLSQWEQITKFSRAKCRKMNQISNLNTWRLPEQATMHECKKMVEVSLQSKKGRLDLPLNLQRIALGVLEFLTNSPDGAKRMSEADQLCNVSIAQLHGQWISLPLLGRSSHLHLMQNLHQFVELQDSITLCRELKTRNIQTLELKQFLLPWRKRLPNWYDSIVHWERVLSWRMSLFTSLKKGQHEDVFKEELLWTKLKFAAVAREHGCYKTSGNVLLSIKGDEFVSSRFEFIAQELWNFLPHENFSFFVGDVSSVNGLEAAMNHVNSVDVQKMKEKEKADIFYLKGRISEAFIDHQKQSQKSTAPTRRVGMEDVTKCYQMSVFMSSTHEKAWLSWGKSCFKELEKDGYMNIQLALDCLVCYLEAIYIGAIESRLLLPRVCQIMVRFAYSPPLAEKFNGYLHEIAPNTWLSILPQLLNMMLETDSPFLHTVIKRLSKQKKHVQSIYYSISHHANVHKNSAVASLEIRNKCISHLESALTDMRGESPVLCREMDIVLQEIPNFFASLCTEVVESLHAFVEKCTVLEGGSTMSACIEELKRLENTLEADISSTTIPVTFAHSILSDIVKKHVATLLSELRDTSLLKGNDCATVVAHVRQTKKTLIRIMRSHISGALFHVAPSLTQFRAQFLLVPCMSQQWVSGQNDVNDGIMEADNKLVRFGDHVDVIVRGGVLHCQLYAMNDYGVAWPLLVVSNRGQAVMKVRRMAQFQSLMNFICDNRLQAKGLHLHKKTQIVVPLDARCFLLRNEIKSVTLESIWESHIIKCENCPDEIMEAVHINFGRLEVFVSGLRQKKHGATYVHDETFLNDAFQCIFKDLNQMCFNKHILSQYLQEVTMSVDHLWHFKQTFATNMATGAFLSHMLAAERRTDSASNFLLSLDDCSLTMPAMDSFKVKQPSVFVNRIPFRFTPNLEEFIGQIATEGTFSRALSNYAEAVSSQKEMLSSTLSFFMWDEDAHSNFDKISLKPSALVMGENSTAAKEMVIRAASLSPLAQKEETDDEVVMQLINAATDPKLLCLMNPSWMPWM
jgi:hypothetical protein